MINFGLLPWLNITLSILIYVAAAYVVLIIINLIFVGWFKKSLKLHSKSMNLVLISKFENIQKLFAIMKKLGVQIDQKYFDMIESLDVNTFKHQWLDECKKAREKLTYLKDEAIFIARKQNNLEKNNEFVNAKNNVLEMETVYRNIVAYYNADVLGFNYWIKFLPNRWIFKLAKVKTRDLI